MAWESAADGREPGKTEDIPTRFTRDQTCITARNNADGLYGCRSWTKFVPSDPRRDPRLRDECDTVPPIFTHPANAPRLTMVTPITRRRIKAAYLWAGLAGLGLGVTLGSHVVRKVQKISDLRI